MSGDSQKDLTHIVRRVPQLEERYGIALEGVYASADMSRQAGAVWLTINADVSSPTGSIAANLTIGWSAYDASNRLVGMGDEMLFKEGFVGFKPVKVTGSLYDAVAQIVLYPRAW